MSTQSFYLTPRLETAEDVSRLVDALEKSLAAEDTSPAVEYHELNGDELKTFLAQIKW